MLAELDRLGTIAAVARSLHLTAPGISMQLAALERETGVGLTERQGRRVIVTPAGKVLAHHGRDIGDLLQAAELEAAALRAGTTGTYRVAAFPTAARSIVADTWAALAASPEPGIQLRLIESEPTHSLPALAAGEVDLVVAHSYSNVPESVRSAQSRASAGRARSAAPAGSARSAVSTGSTVTIDTVALCTEVVFLAVPATDRAAPGAGGDAHDDGPRTVALERYSDRDFIVPGSELSCHEMVLRACGLAGFEPRAVAEVTDFSVQLALVAAGVGVALIPELGAGAVPQGVTLLTLARPVFRYSYLANRRSSGSDAGLARVREELTRAAAARLPGADKPS